MQLVLEKDCLHHLAAMLGEMDEVVVSPKRGALVAYDMARTRRISYSIPESDEDDTGLQGMIFAKIAKRIRDTCDVSITRDGCIVRSGSTTYKIRPYVASEYLPTPVANHTGQVTVRAEDVNDALKDIQISGSRSTVISIHDNMVRFSGVGAFDAEIEIESIHHTGMGYSRLDCELLMLCAQHMYGDITLHLSPKKPTLIKFGGFTYHQAAMR